jgi:Domain of unknown function (DUF4926)
MGLNLNDVVILQKDVPDQGLKAGMKGVVVFMFDAPSLAYEVEFSDNSGRTICTVALQPDQLEGYSP